MINKIITAKSINKSDGSNMILSECHFLKAKRLEYYWKLKIDNGDLKELNIISL
jgi:hypothetical protein